jgi:hypothetical protein
MSHSIVIIEFPKPASAKSPVPLDVFDAHPRPWRLGESKTSTTEIVDAKGRWLATVRHGGILLGHKGTPQRIVDLVNASVESK